VDPKADLDDVEKRKFLPYRDSNSEPSVIQPRSQSLYRQRYPGSDRRGMKGYVTNVEISIQF
jgi:hypothetical protein